MLVAVCLAATLHLAVPLLYVVAAGPQNALEATCESGKGTTTTAMPTYGTVTIACPATTTLQPALEDNKERKVFSCDKDNPTQTPLCNLVPGATLAKETGGGQKIILTVPQLPAAKKSIFFQCKGNNGKDEGKDCFIEVTVPGSPELGPNACAVPETQIDFSASGANAVVQFSCASNTLGQQPGKVLDENCEKELDLASVVPGAQFKQGTQEDKMVQVSFPQPPTQDKKLCFTCDNKDKKRCRVFIHVAGADPAAAVGITARAASALGVVIVAAGLLGMY